MDYVRIQYAGRLKLNELKQQIELDGQEYALEEAYLTLADLDYIDVTKHKAADTFKKVAKENAFNPVKNYLEVVAKTAESISLDNLSSRYFGTTNPIYDSFLKRTLIAAVARIYEPGCKHDIALVLQGKQGIGKSTFFNILGGEWFDDSMGDGRNKDDLIILNKCWLQEWGEIERVFGKRQAGELKAFITRQKDVFRQPYGITALEHARKSIIVGSVNESQFLVDQTGNRRYCVIPIQIPEINTKQLKKERDGIWAAAVQAYKNGEQWWLTKEEQKLSTANNEQFQIVDEWESAIAEYLTSLTRVSITEILVNVFHYDIGKIDRSSQMRVSTILSRQKWKKIGQKQHRGKRQVVWEPTIPKEPPKGTEEVLQPKSLIEQGSSIPTRLAIPNKNNVAKSNVGENKISNEKLGGSVHTGIDVSESSSEQGIEISTPSPKPPNDDAIPWDTYFFEGSIEEKKQRASRVKERLMNCQTSKDFCLLVGEGLVSPSEVDWLREYVLNPAEKDHANLIDDWSI